MAARRFEDLVCWQLARELEREAWTFTSHPPSVRDVKFCQQIREATRSARRNTAEGFGRYNPKEFVHFLRIAAGSLHEAKDCLHQASECRYLSPSEHERLLKLAIRAIKANSSLIRYLRVAKPPAPRKPGARAEWEDPHERVNRENRENRENPENRENRENPENLRTTELANPQNPQNHENRQNHENQRTREPAEPREPEN